MQLCKKCSKLVTRSTCFSKFQTGRTISSKSSSTSSLTKSSSQRETTYTPFIKVTKTTSKVWQASCWAKTTCLSSSAHPVTPSVPGAASSRTVTLVHRRCNPNNKLSQVSGASESDYSYLLPQRGVRPPNKSRLGRKTWVIFPQRISDFLQLNFEWKLVFNPSYSRTLIRSSK